MVLAFLIEQFRYTAEDRTVEMYASSSIMIGMSVIMVFLTHHSFFGLGRSGMKIRIAVSSLMYRKVRTKNDRRCKTDVALPHVNIFVYTDTIIGHC